MLFEYHATGYWYKRNLVLLLDLATILHNVRSFIFNLIHIHTPLRIQTKNTSNPKKVYFDIQIGENVGGIVMEICADIVPRTGIGLKLINTIWKC